MPYGPVLDRAEARRTPAAPTAPADRVQLATAIGACQQQLADLLSRLDAGPDAPADPSAAMGPARQAVAEALQHLDEAAPSPGAQLTEFEERVWHRLVDAMRADGRRLEDVLRADVAAVRADLDAVRNEYAAGVSDVRQIAAGADDRVADALALVRADVESQLTTFAGQVDAVRREQAAVLADLREARARQAAARSSELAGLDRAVGRLEAELRRLMGTIDDRITQQVRRARLGVDEEMAALRTWVENAIAGSTGGVWSALARLAATPVSAVAAIVDLLPRW